jgi:hypothetical protein
MCNAPELTINNTRSSSNPLCSTASDKKLHLRLIHLKNENQLAYIESYARAES